MFQIDPKLGDRPVLSPGTYGEDGSVEIAAVREIEEVPWAPGHHGLEFEILVRHPEFGVVRVRRLLDADVQGTPVVWWLKNLGITEDQMREGIDLKGLEGTKVVAELDIRQYEADGETRTVNTIRQIRAL